MMHGWVNHVRGAIKLLELRGEKQLASAVGMELFTVVRLQSVSYRVVPVNHQLTEADPAGREQCILQDEIPYLAKGAMVIKAGNVSERWQSQSRRSFL